VAVIRGNDVLGLIHSNAYDEVIPELTGLRAMGSVPFGGRYRLIDFPLSCMVNAGISKVGIITKSNYRSLMDHVGSGKPWDLARKREGLFILPPFMRAETGSFTNRIDAFKGNMHFINRSQQEYVLSCDCNTVMNFPIKELMRFHEANGADVTVVTKRGTVPGITDVLLVDKDASGRLTAARTAEPGENGEYSLRVYFLKKALLERLVNAASAQNKNAFERDVIMENLSALKVFAFEARGFSVEVDSISSYYHANMALLDPQNCAELFDREHPIYTKERDDMPTHYGLESKAKACMVSDGCVIKGEICNSLLGKGVTVEKGAVVRNSVLMQGSYVGAGCRLENVIIDKAVVIKPGKALCGADSFPVYVGKGIVI
jgi:glucose-1-phosphate adenylyltransferase